MNDILINEEELNKIITKVDAEIKNMENIYQELDNKLKEIDGSTETWTGNTQKIAYDKYLSISKQFPNSIEQMKSLKDFMKNALDNYVESDKSINKDINNNQDDLTVE